MNLSQYIVDWAKAQGYTMRAMTLYERRRPEEIFINAKLLHRVVFVRPLGAGVEYLTHGQVQVG